MRCGIRVHSGRSIDCDPCISLQIERKFYLFGAPEQVLRLNHQQRIKIANIKQIFITSIYPELSSGLIGLLIETFDISKLNVNIIGPQEFVNMPLLNMNDQFNIGSVLKYGYSDNCIDCEIIKLSKSIAFNIKVHDIKGSIDSNKAISLGVPKGPLLGKLNQGQSVTLDNGLVVNPDDVLNPMMIGERILFIEAIDIKDIALLPEEMSQFDVVVHFTNPILLNSADYIHKFSNIKFNLCFFENDQYAFPRPINLYNSISVSIPRIVSPLASFIPIHYSKQNFYNLGVNSSYTSHPISMRGVLNPVSMNDIVSDPIDLPHTDSFIITCLGSGCKYSSLHRNVSGYLIQTREGFYLLDCGQGTYNQLMIKFGKELTKYILSNLNCIWLSHKHSDHVLGIVRVLYERAMLTNDGIAFFAPVGFYQDLKKKESFFGPDFFHLVECNRDEPISVKNVIIQSYDVHHTPNAKACLFIVDSNHRIVYSGDRSPNVIDIADSIGNCDVLIHESTFPDYLEANAEGYRHSTVSKAIETGRRMNAKFILLSHFSQRMKKGDHTTPVPNVLFLFDFLSIDYSTISEDFPVLKTISEKIINSTIDESEDEEH